MARDDKTVTNLIAVNIVRFELLNIDPHVRSRQSVNCSKNSIKESWESNCVPTMSFNGDGGSDEMLVVSQGSVVCMQSCWISSFSLKIRRCDCR